jgi:cation/acetate symporter
MFIEGTEFMMGMEKNWFFGIDPKAFGSVGALINFLVAFLITVSSCERPPQHVQQLIDDIRVP